MGDAGVIDAVAGIVVLLQVFCIDLLLGADNALVIALACSRLPAAETRQAVMLGAVGAVALRLGMLAFANALLDVPLVKLIAAWTLIVIALNVRAREADDEHFVASGNAGAGDLLAAAATIALADAAMSLDNVVALAAIAKGNSWLLALGVLLSIPIIVYGSLILTRNHPSRAGDPDAGRRRSRLDRGRDGGFRSASFRLGPLQRAGACPLRAGPWSGLRLDRRRGRGTARAATRNRAQARSLDHPARRARRRYFACGLDRRSAGAGFCRYGRA